MAAPHLVPPPDDTAELVRRAHEAAKGSVWAKVAAIIPRKMAEEMLAWAEDEDETPLRFVLTKTAVRGDRRIEVEDSQRYSKRRP